MGEGGCVVTRHSMLKVLLESFVIGGEIVGAIQVQLILAESGLTGILAICRRATIINTYIRTLVII